MNPCQLVVSVIIKSNTQLFLYTLSVSQIKKYSGKNSEVDFFWVSNYEFLVQNLSELEKIRKTRKES